MVPFAKVGSIRDWELGVGMMCSILDMTNLYVRQLSEELKRYLNVRLGIHKRNPN